MTKWLVGLGLYAVGMTWLLWEIRHAGELPHAKACAWCRKPFSDNDKWLISEGATISHSICLACQRQHFPDTEE
ncbi:MAG: hypothetical protein NUW01_16780 [Gemmatimonadaceae bacterium]|nr:hypothetical protein [Gemmatimonadaceae bacterium]